MATAALADGPLAVSMGATAYFGRVSYQEYQGVSLHLDERAGLLAALGDDQAMILRYHGLLVTGRTVPEAVLRLYRLERACQVQLDSAAAGSLRIPPDDVAAKSGAEVERFAASADAYGALEFAALMRRLDCLDPSFRG